MVSFATNRHSAGPPADGLIPPMHGWTLLLLSLVVLLLGLVPRPLWGTDEAILGEIVREMLADGEWLVPHLNQAIYPDKPPLYYWLAALPALATGTLTPLWFRLPAIFSAIGTLWLTYAFGTQLFNRTTGLLAALILATSPLFTITAQIARQDMVITLLLTASLYCLARGLHEPAAARRWYLALYLLTGLSFLTKGLIGPALLAVVIVVVMVWRQDWRLPLRMEPWRGAVVTAVVVLPWLIPAVRQEGVEYARALLIQQSVGRAIDAFTHAEPVYYYLLTFPPSFLPWVVFLPAACLLLWRLGPRDWRTILLLAWTAGLFLFLSLTSSKLAIYLLPLFPGFALIVAHFWQQALSNGNEQATRRQLWWPTLIGAGLFAAAAVVAAAGRLLPPDIPLSLLFINAALIAAIMVAGLAIRRRPLSQRLFSILLLATVLTLGLAKVATTRLDDRLSPMNLGRTLQRYHDAVPTMATYKVRRGLLNYYSERHFEELDSPEAVRQFLSQTMPVLCIMQDKFWVGMKDDIGLDLSALPVGEVGTRHYLLITNAPLPPPAEMS